MKTTEDPTNNCDRDSDSHPRLVMPRLPVSGWQWVKCDDCGTTWKETSRDIQSPSLVDCINRCDHGGDTHVWKTEQADLPRDQNGNLLNYERVILTKGLGHNDQEHPATEKK